jgi:hypothetical protein
MMDAFNAFVTRLFYFGDILLYWGQENVRREFAGLGFSDYLKDTFGSILGALRLMDYGTPIGNQFVKSTLPYGTEFSDSLGPNLQFYVRGELYLGIVLAPLHASAIGFLFGRVRRYFIMYRGRSLLRYSLLAYSVIMSLTLMSEEGLAIGQIFDFMIFFGPIYLVTLCFTFPIQRDLILKSKALLIQHKKYN